MQKIYQQTEGSLDVMLDVINAILEAPGGMIVCDLMACEGSVTHHLKVGKKIYVDIAEHNIRGFEKHKDEFILMDAIEYLKTTDKKFNLTISLDGIEHLSKERGLFMLELMREKSDNQIIFTPLGDFVVEPETENPDGHKSGWLPEDFEKLGWAVLTFPKFHVLHGTGGFFAFHCKDLKNEFARVNNVLEFKKTNDGKNRFN